MSLFDLRISQKPFRSESGWVAMRASTRLGMLLLGIQVASVCGCLRHQQTAVSRADKADRLSMEARQARDRGDLQSAETLMTAAVDGNPYDDETRLELSELLLVHHQSSAAAKHLSVLQERLPDDSRVYAGLAEVRYQQNQLNEADLLVSQALDLDPRLEQALLLRAKIETARGHHNIALDQLYQIFDLEGDHSEARLLAARLHLQHGDSRMAAAELRSMLEMPNLDMRPRASANWLLGQCYSQEERWQEAADALAAGMPSRPGNAADWLLVAKAWRNAGHLDKAARAVETALKRSPGNSELLALQQGIAAESQNPLPGQTILQSTFFDDDIE